MPRLQEGDMAPDFEAKDLHDKKIKLSELLKNGPVYLVLNRGFA